MSKRRHF